MTATLCRPHTHPIDIHTMDGTMYCLQFGKVFGYDASKHVWHKRRGQCNRECFHRLETMPKTQLFGTTWLETLGWQLMPQEIGPFFASRAEGFMTIACHVLGPIMDCKGTGTLPPDHRWRYRLYPIRWEDKRVAKTVLLGVVQ